MVSITNRGIGTGIFLDGKIFRGHDGFAGEMGHMTINMEGPRCNCGNRGCWEMYASPRALMDYFKNVVNIFNPNVIIIRGAIAEAGRWIFNPIYRTLSERCYFSHR